MTQTTEVHSSKIQFEWVQCQGERNVRHMALSISLSASPTANSNSLIMTANWWKKSGQPVDMENIPFFISYGFNGGGFLPSAVSPILPARPPKHGCLTWDVSDSVVVSIFELAKTPASPRIPFHLPKLQNKKNTPQKCLPFQNEKNNYLISETFNTMLPTKRPSPFCCITSSPQNFDHPQPVSNPRVHLPYQRPPSSQTPHTPARRHVSGWPALTLLKFREGLRPATKETDIKPPKLSCWSSFHPENRLVITGWLRLVFWWHNVDGWNPAITSWGW